MTKDNLIGIWLIGAWGGVSTTVAVGLAALQQKLTRETGLVSALPFFQNLDLASWSQFVVGGHEIRKTSFQAEAEVLWNKSRIFTPQLLSDVKERLHACNDNVRTGTLINVGTTITSLADQDLKQQQAETVALALERIREDLRDFRERHQLKTLIVVNLASTEPPLEMHNVGLSSWEELSKQLENSQSSPIPASSIYAIAAMQEKAHYINFTPSVGSNLPALNDLAVQQGVHHVGRDGKTGETLLKSVLAPMFASRNLEVSSWVGHNIFGNMDGKVLDDPINKANKVRSKDHLLTEILGYKPQTLVSIEYIESLGDWKTAWDHIHFNGFLDTQMILQFTWQGCDSILAAPLVLDLVRLTERESRRNSPGGILSQFSSFFKSPMGTDVPEFHRQYQMLEEWMDSLRKEQES